MMPEATELNRRAPGVPRGTDVVRCRVGRLVWQRQSARRGIAVLAVLSAFSKGLGFVRELAIAYFFGATWLVDAYRIGETVNGLASSMARQAFDVVGVPLLVERRTRHGEKAERGFAAALSGLGFLYAGLILLATLLLAPFIVRLFAPNLSGATARLAVLLTRVMVPVGVATTLAGAATAYYNARRQFAVPRLFDPVVNLVAIGLLVLAARRLGVVGLAAGWGAGHLAGLAVVLVPLVMTGRRLCGSIRDPGVREFIVLSLPVLLVAAVQQANVAVARAFASFLPAGSIAMLGYADRLFILPCYFLGTVLAPVFYTKVSELAARGEHARLRHHVQWILGRLALILVPASFFLLFLARPLVRLLYERGAFSADATAATAAALAFMGLGLFPYAAVSVLTAAFRSRKDTRTPAWAALSGIGLNVVLAALLVRSLGLRGLALASSCGLTLTALILAAVFARPSGQRSGTRCQK